MPEPREIKIIRINSDFHVCPECGYALGFHTSFVTMNAHHVSPVKPSRKVYRVILICPECGARYDVGWKTSFTG